MFVRSPGRTPAVKHISEVVTITKLVEKPEHYLLPFNTSPPFFLIVPWAVLLQQRRQNASQLFSTADAAWIFFFFYETFSSYMMKCIYFPSFSFWSRPPSTLVILTICVCYSSQLQRLIGFQKPQPNSNCASLISRHKLKAVCSRPGPRPSHFWAQLLVSHCCGLERGSRAADAGLPPQILMELKLWV